MARLRIRIELNRGGVGVPLQKLASVVAEAQKFFHMLGNDIHIDQENGEWLGFDFDHESLNFTAEFVGPVTADQVSAFNAAFDGTTSLSRATITQFARITDAIEEDELIGFGLFLNGIGNEPGEWRCLSRRDALRISEEIRLLAGSSEGAETESHLPAVSDSGIGARLFSERRDRTPKPAKWAGVVREVEANLARRIGKLETEVGEHSIRIEDLRAQSVSSEASIGRLVSAVEGFCEQATRRLEAMPPQAALPAAAAVSTPAPATAPTTTPTSAAAPASTPASHGFFHWQWTPVISVATALAIIGLSMLLWPNRPDNVQKTSAAAPVEQAPVQPTVSNPPATATVASAPAKEPAPAPAKASVPQPPAEPGVPRIDLEASEPSWISVTEEDGHTLMSDLLQPDKPRSLNLAKNAVLRAGNAGGLTIRFNGKSIGPIGPHGGVRDVEFKDGAYHIVVPGK
jgi:hypothetical protein